MSEMPTQDRPHVIVLADDDNVCVACESIELGQSVIVDGERIRVHDTIQLGHKLARCDIPEGGEIIKYGAPVGIATRAIRRGEHVHVQNMKSAYLPTYTLDGTNSYIGRAP